MLESLSGQNVLITGASAGIGLETARQFIQQGAHVFALGRQREPLNTLKVEFPEKVTPLIGDVREDVCLRLIEEVSSEIDIFVNNAGVLRYAPVLELSPEDTEWMFEINVVAAFKASQIIGRAMAKRGAGHIIFVTSTAAREVFAFASIYSATKHALSAIARSMRLELQHLGIRVTEVAPGMVATDIRKESSHPRVVEALAARKFAPLSSNDVAESILFAAMTKASSCPEFIEIRPKGAA